MSFWCLAFNFLTSDGTISENWLLSLQRSLFWTFPGINCSSRVETSIWIWKMSFELSCVLFCRCHPRQFVVRFTNYYIQLSKSPSTKRKKTVTHSVILVHLFHTSIVWNYAALSLFCPEGNKHKREEPFFKLRSAVTSDTAGEIFPLQINPHAYQDLSEHRLQADINPKQKLHIQLLTPSRHFSTMKKNPQLRS